MEKLNTNSAKSFVQLLKGNYLSMENYFFFLEIREEGGCRIKSGHENKMTMRKRMRFLSSFEMTKGDGCRIDPDLTGKVNGRSIL